MAVRMCPLISSGLYVQGSPEVVERPVVPARRLDRVHIALRQIARCSGHMDDFHSSISLSSLHPVNLHNLLQSDGSLYEARVHTICFSYAYLCEICCSIYRVRLALLMQKSTLFFSQNKLKGSPGE